MAGGHAANEDTGKGTETTLSNCGRFITATCKCPNRLPVLAELGQWCGEISDVNRVRFMAYTRPTKRASGTSTPIRLSIVTFLLLLQSVSHCLVAPSRANADDGSGASGSLVSEAGSLRVQTTGIWQGYPAIRAPYSGDNSLTKGPDTRHTITATIYAGMRLWDGAELFINAEGFHGFGLGETRGIAGFPNGEAQKGGTAAVDPSFARYLLRQTIGFGGEQEKKEDDLNALPGMRDVHRLTITAGKVSVTDIFDDNAYAHDSRTSFMNWSIWEAGAFDYAADVKGYTEGLVLDYNQKHWALRMGYFLVPTEPNSANLDQNYIKRGAYIGEFEHRYQLMGQDGKLRLLGFYDLALSANYGQAIAAGTLGPPDVNDTRKIRDKRGFVVNLEQSLTKDLGLFSRLSWNDGKNESVSFTDIDRSISVGLSLKGAQWGRPDDTVGIAGAFNGISKSHIDFFKAGGDGLLIGDGRLSYAGEKIVETYYTFRLQPNASLTADYQFIGNPAFNKDRGPINVVAGRYHVEF